MANSEASFKSEFRRDLKEFYKDWVHIWTTNDMFRAGVPDFNITYLGVSAKGYLGVEAKFVKELPARDTSKVLTHQVTAGQMSHMKALNLTRQVGIVLVGLPDIAVFVPTMLIVDGNVNLKTLRMLSKTELACPKVKGHWQFSKHKERGPENILELLTDGSWMAHLMDRMMELERKGDL